MNNENFKIEVCGVCKDKRCGRTDKEIENCLEFGLYRNKELFTILGGH